MWRPRDRPRGLCVIRTFLAARDLAAVDFVRSYKVLTWAARVFRTLLEDLAKVTRIVCRAAGRDGHAAV